MAGIGHNGGPAFPSEGEGHGNPKYHSPGMSLRDYFAGQALVGILSDRSKMATSTPYIVVAQQAYKIADAMLAAREETP